MHTHTRTHTHTHAHTHTHTHKHTHTHMHAHLCDRLVPGAGLVNLLLCALRHLLLGVDVD
jgi:hypothetical protein